MRSLSLKLMSKMLECGIIASCPLQQRVVEIVQNTYGDREKYDVVKKGRFDVKYSLKLRLDYEIGTYR
jgi:hypothetical protein